MCLFARRKLKRCVGIEMFESLCLIARENATRLRGRRAPIDIVCEDAAEVDLADGTIYFLYNPFGPQTLSDVLENIRNTCAANPRRITVVYYNSVHEDVLKACAWLYRVHVLHNASNQRITFWNNNTAASPSHLGSTAST